MMKYELSVPTILSIY